MKKLIFSGIVAAMFSSCAMVQSPAYATLYTDVKAGAMVTSNSLGKKVGTGEAQSILGIIATGDASIESAAKKAGISKVSHVDYQSKNILGIIATYTIFVYGE